MISEYREAHIELSQNEDIFKDELRILISNEFNTKDIEIKQKKEILIFFNKISSNYLVYFFNFEVHKFVNPEFDELLKDIFYLY